jgi:hypothetical protein
VLLIAVDQFRYDYLTRFRSEYTSGFNRLLTDGADFTNAFLEHYPTVTAIGHSTMMSGATPALSGIVGNDWFDRAAGKSVTSVEDPETKLVGGTEGTGFSPRRMLVNTVGDELKSASRAAVDSPLYPKVFGLSLKDRSAVLPAGHMANAAFCFDTKTGAFVTSTYYRTDLPAWAAAFNAKKPADAFAGKTWTYLNPAAGSAGTLPPVGDTLYNAVFGSPFGNDLLLSFALTAIEAEQLGQRGVTDLLSVSFSSNDSVGHSFGPDSLQVHDIAVRTDRTIGELLARVDKLVGLDHTLVVLTADHGVAPVPEVQQQRHLPGGRLTKDEAMTPIATALTAKVCAGELDHRDGWHVAVSQLRADRGEASRSRGSAKRWPQRPAAQLPHVARVYTRDQVLSGQVTPDTIGRPNRAEREPHAFRRSRDRLRAVLDARRERDDARHAVRLRRAHSAGLHGTGHPPGHYDANVALNDLAPTVATLIAVETPSGSQGRVLTEMLSATESVRPGSH